MGKKVSVVVATLNEKRFIGNLINSIKKCSYPNKEVIVVDGGSTDGTTEIAEERGAEVIEEKGDPKGPSHARNQGVRCSNAEVVCVMDADEKVEDGFFKNAMKHFENEKVAAVKPGERPVIIDNFVENLHAKTIRLKNKMSELVYGKSTGSILSGESSEAIPKFYFWRRNVWFEIGGHPESAGWKELVIFKKKAAKYLKKNDLKAIIEPKSKVYFHMQHTWERLFKSFRWYGRTMIDYFKTDEDAGFREVVANLHQPLFFFLFLAIFLPFPVISLPALGLFIIRFLISIPFTIQERDPVYMATPLLDLIGGLGIIIGLLERIGGSNLSRG